MEILKLELCNELKNTETLTVVNNENRCLLEEKEEQQRFLTGLEMELSAVVNLNTKLATYLKSVSTKIGSYTRKNMRDKEQEKGSVGSTLFNNVQGVLDKAMRRSSSRKK